MSIDSRKRTLFSEANQTINQYPATYHFQVAILFVKLHHGKGLLLERLDSRLNRFLVIVTSKTFQSCA